MQELTVPQLSDGALRHYLDEATEQFNQAAAHTISVQHFFQIADQTVEILIAGEGLLHLLTPALIHRTVPPPTSAPDLTIRAFDTASTGVPMPRPIWPDFSHATRSGLLPGISNQQLLATYNFNTGVFNMLDTLAGQGIYWVHDGRHYPSFEMAIPFRIQFYWWMRTRGYHIVHGAVVSKPKGGLILVGQSGSGKSTAALACLGAGWDYLADDIVLFGLNPQPTAYNIYQSARVTHQHFGAHFSSFKGAVHDTSLPSAEKTLMFLDDHFPGRIPSQCPLVALVFPQIAQVPTPRLKPVAPQSTLIALAATTLKMLPGANHQDLKAMMALVEQIPTYSLEIGGDPDQIPMVLDQLLQ